eukprot:jgi/Mesvir1/21269/Mv21670-RA.1
MAETAIICAVAPKLGSSCGKELVGCRYSTFNAQCRRLSKTQSSGSVISWINSAPNGVGTVQTRCISSAGESEAQRLARDKRAMDNMKEVAAASLANGAQTDGGWKWDIRKRIWDKMEAENLADFPRPVHHRIPNFVGADQAADKLASLPEFFSAQTVKVNPDTPQRQVRYRTLIGGKQLLCPQPRLRTGFFSTLSLASLPDTDDDKLLRDACKAAGIAKYGTPIGLGEKLRVDLVVVGSAAVTPEGARLGKGEGFAELEYAILRLMGAIDEHTLVVTTVHDCQVLDAGSIPLDKLRVHDVPVDIICTPTRIIRTNTAIPKPGGVFWDLLSPEKLAQIRILRELKSKIERETGTKLPEGPSEQLPPRASRTGEKPPRRAVGKMLPLKALDAPDGQKKMVSSCVFVWNLPFDLKMTNLAKHVKERAGVERLNGIDMLPRQGGRFGGMARIYFTSAEEAEVALGKLQNSSIKGRPLQAKLHKSPAVASVA